MTEKGKINIAATILLFAAIFVVATPAEAVQDLSITSYNLDILQSHATWTSYGSGKLMTWPSSLDATNQRSITIGSITGTEVADNNGYYWGECVSLAKSLSKNNLGTNSWIKGNNVISSYSVTPGTIVATFGADGHYSGHVAIFASYLIVQGQPIGINIWDQNYIATHAVGKHTLMNTGSGVGDADNYYVVRVP